METAFYNGILYQIEYKPELSNNDCTLYQLKNNREPSMAHALHVYYEFTYNEELDMYVYTFVRPYDD